MPSPTAEGIEAAHILKVNQAIDSLKTQHLTTSWGDRLLTIDKTAGFKADPAFHAAFESVKGYIFMTNTAGLIWWLGA